MYRWFTGGLLVVYWWCTDGVLVVNWLVYWWCTGGVLMVTCSTHVGGHVHFKRQIVFAQTTTCAHTIGLLNCTFQPTTSKK